MSSYFIVLLVGLLAQGFFSARTLVQWILSERAKRVLSPTLFWILSLSGSYLLCLYGWLRGDLSIVLGQFISYYVYLWNLKLKNSWKNIPFILRAVLLLTPAIAVIFGLQDADSLARTFLQNEDIPLGLLLFGIVGQVLFTLRFVYQLIYSYRKQESVLPTGFWLISLAGSLLIATYGLIRLDAVLILGQSFGMAAYARNLWIGHHTKLIANEN